MPVDFIELSSDDEDDEAREEHAVHRQGHSVQVEGEFINLTTEHISEARHNVHAHGDSSQNTMSQSCGLNAKDGHGEVAQCKGGFVADNGQGGAAHTATPPHMLEPIADDGKCSAHRCSTTAQRQGSTTDGQSSAAQCTTPPQSLESVSDDGQGDIAHCTARPQRLESLATHRQGNTAQCTNTSHYQDLPAAADWSAQSGSAAYATSSLSGTQLERHRATSQLNLPPGPTAAPFPRQFWKAGEYRLSDRAGINGGQNRLRIHPNFLHSNATSHKWAFGAIAELLDNAVDEIHNGATFVKIDKIKHAPDGEYSLMIQDDGGGMSPESLRCCLSFGFSHKSSTSSIGQYGNGFKTSTMRLGADVIVFTCKQDRDNRILTQSVGLLSYTFLMATRCNDILVPAVDYEFDTSSSTFKRIINYGEKHFWSNLSALLKWSPFSTEEELLNQFRGMNFHGTKIIVFNLWFNDEREMELDFMTDKEDIMISGAKQAVRGTGQGLKQMHVAVRLCYSLRVYSSILYLHLPENFRIILCGRVVEPRHIINDLIYRECIKYRPQVNEIGEIYSSILYLHLPENFQIIWCGRVVEPCHIANDIIYRECIKYRPQVNEIAEVDVYTTIGFLKGAPKLDIYGFNVYHKNRLILPFWPAGPYKHQRRGIAGVLETNFIRPTHDKQDFEKTGLFHRLETRLKDMAMEYWSHHCHLVGYVPIARSVPPSYYVSTSADNNDCNLASQATTNTYYSRERVYVPLHPCSNENNLQDPLHLGALTNQMDPDACPSTSINVGTISHLQRNTPQQYQTGLCKRRNSSSVIYSRVQKRQKSDALQPGSDSNIAEITEEQSRIIADQNVKLKAECSELKAAAQHMISKVDELTKELDRWKSMCKGFTDELQSLYHKEALLRKHHH